MKLFSNRARPVHLGPYRMERLARTTTTVAPPPPETLPEPGGTVDEAALDYLRLFDTQRSGAVASARAPISADPDARAKELKAAAYFLDADVAGIGSIVPDEYALVVLVSHVPFEGSSPRLRAATRAAGIASILACYVRLLGYDATAHTESESDVSLPQLAIAAGVATTTDGRLSNPFLGHDFSVAAVTTRLALHVDRPLAKNRVRVRVRAPRRSKRPAHLGPYPMERIRRVDEPTTLVLEDEIPRVPLRAQFFHRARRGDLGQKAKRESNRFSIKHPLAKAMRPLFRAMVPHQGGTAAPAPSPGTDDAEANTRYVKSLAYALGANAVGVCEAKPFAWYSHDLDGEAIEPYHRYAVVILIDQGHDTMEAASGDDWMSGVQSMRAYVRGAEVVGQLAAVIRKMGHGARSHTNSDSHVLHIPLLLLAGLGELSRIGELVLNPFLGARFKSVVVTTDLPLTVDRPIDFGLQDFCRKCLKCARECPVSAISFGDPVMFNGYEMWKPDVERCTRYRVTNPNGSACGRCMKMCPFTNEGLLMHRAALWVAIHVPPLRRFLAKLDDWIGHGKRNRVKKWWSDLEWLPDGPAVRPRGINVRDLNLERANAPLVPIQYHHANMMPPPNAKETVPLDRRASRDAANVVETPGEAMKRRREGRPAPPHYKPTAPR